MGYKNDSMVGGPSLFLMLMKMKIPNKNVFTMLPTLFNYYISLHFGPSFKNIYLCKGSKVMCLALITFGGYADCLKYWLFIVFVLTYLVNNRHIYLWLNVLVITWPFFFLKRYAWLRPYALYLAQCPWRVILVLRRMLIKYS